MLLYDFLAQVFCIVFRHHIFLLMLEFVLDEGLLKVVVVVHGRCAVGEGLLVEKAASYV